MNQTYRVLRSRNYRRRMAPLRLKTSGLTADEPADNIPAFELAESYLEKLDEALTEARLAYFRLCLLPPSSLRGDAERLLGRILLRQRQKEEALERFQDAQSTHLARRNTLAAAVNTSWLLELAIQRNDQAAIVDYTTELADTLEDLPHPLHGELLHFRLYRAFHWLRERSAPAHDPIEYLRKAYQELIRKTGFLAPQLRHRFLFSIREHQDLLNAATAQQIPLPAFSPVAVMRDTKRSSEP
jgi:hypothetical protein